MRENKIELELVFIKEKGYIIRSNEYTKEIIKQYIKDNGEYIYTSVNLEWNLDLDILQEKEFQGTLTKVDRLYDSIKELENELNSYAKSLEKKNTKELKYVSSNQGSILKKDCKKYTVNLDLDKFESKFRDIIEEYTTALTKPNNYDVDFVMYLDKIKEGIQNKKIKIEEAMAFISDLNDYLTDVVAGRVDE